MKSVLASALALVFGFGSHPAEPAGRWQRTVSPDATASLQAAPAPSPALDETAPAVTPLRRILRPHRLVLVPEDCATRSEPLDLMIHFHGAPERVEPAFARTSLDAALLIVNLGAGSGRYESTFAQAGTFGRWLDGMEKLIAKECGERALGRVALSSWSAGYGAIYRILGHQDDAARVDAVLLADGLHAGYEPGDRSRVNVAQMAPFARFAERAALGEVRLAISHSNIRPPNYASAGDTAAHLLQTVSLERTVVDETGPRSLRLTSRAERGGLQVLGFTGTGPDEHCDHLYALDQLTWKWLRSGWA